MDKNLEEQFKEYTQDLVKPESTDDTINMLVWNQQVMVKMILNLDVRIRIIIEENNKNK